MHKLATAFTHVPFTIFIEDRRRLGNTRAQMQAFGLVLRSPFTIFIEDRRRLGNTRAQKQAFGLVLRSPFTIFEVHYSINIAIHPFHNMIPLLKALYSRHSVRRYLHQPLTPQLIAQLQTKIDECNRLGNLHIQLVTNETRAFSGVMAYGSFSGVENYLVMVGKPHPTLDERIGYYGEQLVLFAQQLGLNTCWAGLSYRKVKGAYHVSSGEKLVCMIALGYGKTQGVTHKIKRPEEVSNIGAQTPEWFAKGVEAALLAPTAINQQKFYFEYQSCPEDPRHGVKAIRRFSLVGYTQMDLGIAKLHFEIGAAAAAGVAEAEALFRWME